MLPNIAPMIPPAPPALLQKLRSAERRNLFSPDSKIPVASPCVSVCRMDEAKQYCIGCLRTLDELRVWGSSDDATKRDIWQRIRQRATATTI
jgi:predicted Fe-S protein YdhL (DUF1289 family)